MQLIKLALILSITLTALSFSGCKTEEIPDNSPYVLHDNGQGFCQRFKLVDKVNLIYAFDQSAPCVDVNDGFAFRKGELEKVLQYIRDQKVICDKAILDAGNTPQP